MDDERRGYSGLEDDTDWLAELLADVDLGQWEDEPPKQQSARRENARQTAPRQPQAQPQRQAQAQSQRQTSARQAQGDRPRQSRYDGEVPQRPQQVRRQPAYEEEPPRQQRRQAPRDDYDERQPRRTQRPQQAPQQRPRQPQYQQQAQPQRPRQPQPQRRAPAPADGQYQDRAARERAVRQVEVRPPAYARRRDTRQRQSVLLIVLIVVLAGGMLFAGGKLVSIFLNYHRDRSAYNDLADSVITDLADGEEEDPQATPDPNSQQQAPTETAPIAVNWDSLRASNSDVVAWIYCPGTPINYPVVQTADNDFYLHRGVDKQTNTSGTLFADKNSSLGIAQSNYIIYGHNMKDGSMFATVEDYLDPSFYDQHPEMYLLTPTGNYKVELIAAHIVEASLDNYPGYFSSTADYSAYLGTITSGSSFYSKYPMDTNYQLLTLSTCDYSANYADPRCLLHGLMVPIG